MKTSLLSRLIAALFAITLGTISASAKAAGFQNISTRVGLVYQGETSLIAGFIISGQAPKKVILRGLGPSLALPEFLPPLPDPVLELHKPDGTVVTNDNWRDTQEQEIIDTGLAPADGLESAIVATLPAGAYTAVLRREGIPDGSPGAALVEVYDLDQTADSILANISSRGYTLTQDSAMIGGIILGPAGTGDSTVVVRGLGPSLFGQDIPSPLYDPTIEIYNSDGSIIGFNDNWAEDPDAGEIIALGLNPGIDREAALKLTLAPGAYTVIVRGTGVDVNLAGVALVEAYNVQ